MNQNYNLIIVGAGPSGVFTAYELIELGLAKDKKILIIEQGKCVEKRSCPIEKIGKCTKCKPFCNITSGFSGAGAFSDGKLTLPNDDSDSIEVGGILDKYLGAEKTKELMHYTDEIYLRFGADTEIEGVEYAEEIQKIADRAKENGITLANCPIRHLGTEKSHELYKKIEEYLLSNNIEILFEKHVKDLIIEDGKVHGVIISDSNNTNSEETLLSENIVLGINQDYLREQKKILISYLDYDRTAYSLRHANVHTNLQEMMQMIKVLIDMDYSIDVCACNNEDAALEMPSDYYDVIFGFGDMFKLAKKRNPKAYTIMYMTENPYTISRNGERERIDYFYERTGRKISYARTGKFYMENDELLADAVICLGEKNYFTNKKIQRIYPSAFKMRSMYVKREKAPISLFLA